MSIKLSAEIHVTAVNGKETEEDVSLIIRDNDDGGIDLVIEDSGNEKEQVLSFDKDELMEAVARVAGGDIRIATKEDD